MTIKELRELVAVMRELGVVQCNGVVVGPEPYPRKNAGILQDWDPPTDDVSAETQRVTIEQFRKKAGR